MNNWIYINTVTVTAFIHYTFFYIFNSFIWVCLHIFVSTNSIVNSYILVPCSNYITSNIYAPINVFMAQEKRGVSINYFSYFSMKTCCGLESRFKWVPQHMFFVVFFVEKWEKIFIFFGWKMPLIWSYDVFLQKVDSGDTLGIRQKYISGLWNKTDH